MVVGIHGVGGENAPVSVSTIFSSLCPSLASYTFHTNIIGCFIF